MGNRRKKPDEGTDHEAATVVADPPGDERNHVQTPPPETNGEVTVRPAKSFAVMAGGGATVEAAVWPKEITVEGRAITVYSATVRKTYVQDGQERHTQSYRGGELHLVTYVLDCASRWIIDQRREEDPPF